MSTRTQPAAAGPGAPSFSVTLNLLLALCLQNYLRKGVPLVCAGVRG